MVVISVTRCFPSTGATGTPLPPLARKHGLETLWITCNPDNVASSRTCESLGAEVVEKVDPPRNKNAYRKGERQKLRYKIEL